MSTTKSTGATKLGRDSQPKYLGIKLSDGEKARPGMIILKQRGTKFLAGKNVKKAGDDSLYAMKEGTVRYTPKKKIRFDGSRKIAKSVSVE